MTLYAHAVIEDPDSGERFERGDTVPADLEGIDQLKKAGSVSTKSYDPESDHDYPDADE